MAGIIDWTTVAPVIALGWRYVGAGALHGVVIGVRHSYSQARAALLRIYAPSFYATEKYTDVSTTNLYRKVEDQGDEIVRVALPNRGPLSRPNPLFCPLDMLFAISTKLLCVVMGI
jgi:hypothetical protein